MDGATAVFMPAQAEVEEIWPRDGRILIRGTVAGGDSWEAGTLVVRDRESRGRELRLPATGADSRFEASIGLDELAAACSGPEQTWDLYLKLPGRAEVLRLGRHLDDIAGKKKIFTYPAQAVAGMWIEPYYTVKDNLSVVCRREAS
ncbi:hypothetical protein RM550_03335 [Streptomyces sp. DSM 41527]|uniref:Uncharacterized protein n=1 Tax=Streptomyces mooreae TaxID=3075523 RepID=A0ABU2T2E1_9ACTN|nr:hypothetical protein [Streptomyces sp. DSM 41527]MDT0454774.1 hypothetical protein [Streptomyces sp. DSM 41527]